tara:strand:+ start:19 stop:471 length:453 start_codon:yes stop_codon:yes gene_type:complete
MMNKILILVMIFSFSMGFGQGKTSFERIKALKMAYIAEKIDLADKEETFFWEVYDEYELKIYKECRKKLKEIRKKYSKNIDSLTKEEAINVLEKVYKIEHLAVDFEEERDKTLLINLSPKKILKIHLAEYHFNREMVYNRKKPAVQKKKD